MSEGNEQGGAGVVPAPQADDADAAPAPPAAPGRPSDPVARELEPVEAAMSQVRGGASDPGGSPTVPGDDEVAALEHAHDVVRSTLDRVDRGG